MSQPPALDVVVAFRRRLADLPEPPHRSRGVPAAAAITALAAVPLVAVLSGTDGPSEALAITRDATSLELRIADATADAREMTAELNDAGIRGRVLVVPVSPPRVGEWVVTAEMAERATCIPAPGAPPAPEEIVRLDDIENTGTVLRIPVDRVRESRGSFVLVAGRDAEPGERAVDVGSPAAVYRDVLGTAVREGTSDRRLPAC